MNEYFLMNDRLGIPVPNLQLDWKEYSKETREQILLDWEKVRGAIPDRIADLEDIINKKQAQLSDEADFQQSCLLNNEIAELASIINDLWLWYRTDQDISAKMHQ